MKANESAPENTDAPTVVTNPLPVNLAEGEALILLREIGVSLATIHDLQIEQLRQLRRLIHRLP